MYRQNLTQIPLSNQLKLFNRTSIFHMADFPIKQSRLQEKTTAPRIVRVFEDFCMNSSIHGIRYFLDRKRHWIERIWWIIAFALSVYLCMNSIYLMWQKWKENPVIISFDHRPLHISAIPFPSMTICPLTKSRSEIFQYSHVYRLMTKLDGTRAANQTELKFMNAACQLCEENIASDIWNISTDNFTDDSIYTTIKEMAPKYDDVQILCNTFGEWTDCTDVLFPIYTEEGLCYVFNSKNVNDIVKCQIAPALINLPSVSKTSKWNPATGYDENDSQLYPYRAFGTGKRESLAVYLETRKPDLDYMCGGSLDGFRVTFNQPNEWPQVWKRYFQMSVGKAGMFLITPNYISTSPNLRDFDPNVRQCYFDGQRALHFFKYYTKHNCELECLANYTLSECECVRFSMPRTKDTKICGPKKLPCLIAAEKDLYMSGAANACNCLPSCATITYDVELNQINYDIFSAWTKSKHLRPLNTENSTFGRVMVSFKQQEINPLKRVEFHSPTDFLASSGGLFGLFMGASLLSFVELIYYFTLRLFYTKHQPKESVKQLPIRNRRIFTILE